MAWTDLTLATERLTLHALAEDDEAAFVAIRTDAETCRMLGGPVDPGGDVDPGRSVTSADEWGSFAVHHRELGTVIGIVSLTRADDDDDALELRCEFLADHQGQGLPFEAVGAVLGWVGAHTDDDEVIAVTRTADTPSVDMLERLGFELIRTVDEDEAEQAEYRRPIERRPMGG